mmetsp:Transcript_15231/g.31472  ORF Transcript_15231/g.31472 Transcript_15231/m.31472 type:complete len:223 (+) Transcript_15231:877-1545(+)
MIPIMTSSGTSFPPSMYSLALTPTSVPAATAARNISPVDKWTMPYSSLMISHCVPFPLAGAPAMIMLTAFEDSPSLSVASALRPLPSNHFCFFSHLVAWRDAISRATSTSDGDEEVEIRRTLGCAWGKGRKAVVVAMDDSATSKRAEKFILFCFVSFCFVSITQHYSGFNPFLLILSALLCEHRQQTTFPPCVAAFAATHKQSHQFLHEQWFEALSRALVSD